MWGDDYMCYKEEKHIALNRMLADKLENIPDFISDFFDRYKSAATKNCNWGYIRDLLEWLIIKKYISKNTISDITIQDINCIKSNHIIKYLNELQSGQYKRKNTLDSIRTKKNVFSAFWNYMFVNKYVDDNIIQHIPSKLFKQEETKKEVYVPTDEQINRFLENIGNDDSFITMRNLAIVKLFIGSGIRSEELINLDMKDLHLDENPAYIMVLGKGKLEKYDEVYISKAAKDTLMAYLNYRKEFVKENNIEDNAVFLSSNKRRISKTVITSFFDKYSEGQIFPHALRHWVGTRLYESTKDIVLVQEQLRHKDLETTKRYYVHMDKSKIANAVAGL